MELSQQQFKALVNYTQTSYEELKRRFPAYINPEYKGKKFVPIECCKAAALSGDREVAFEYIHMDRIAYTVEVLAEMDRKGLRPALYEELLAFAEKYPDEQRKFPIVALGSETRAVIGRYIAYLWSDGDGRCLCLNWLGYVWSNGHRFLAVRK